MVIRVKIFIAIILNSLVLLCNSQTLDRSFHYTNFDGSSVDIDLEINESFVNYSNQNWFDIGTNTLNSSKNYFNLVQGIFNNNRDSLKFVFDMFEITLYNVSDEYFINTVIRFVQSIPYKIPPLEYKGKKTSGLFAPVICLAEGYGDCDTKSLLLCSILAHKYELIFLMGSSHAFIGIKTTPQTDQEYVEINGFKYILCEMTSKWPLGKLPVSSVSDINARKYKYLILKY
jgi:hypothetical protein